MAKCTYTVPRLVRLVARALATGQLAPLLSMPRPRDVYFLAYIDAIHSLVRVPVELRLTPPKADFGAQIQEIQRAFANTTAASKCPICGRHYMSLFTHIIRSHKYEVEYAVCQALLKHGVECDYCRRGGSHG